MGYEKHRRPLMAPSFTPNPTGIALADLAQGADGQLPVAQSGGSTTYRTVSGDVTIDKNGVVSLDPKLIKCAVVNLSAAQITTLHSAPVSLIAAPGANKVIVPHRMHFQFKYGTVQFTGGGAVNPVFHGATANLLGASVAAATLQAAASALIALGPAAGPLTLTSNAGVDLYAATADFAAGDGTAIVSIWYSQLTLG